MDRRAYERMEQEVRAIHRALTGEDPPVGGAALAPAAPPPAEDELERRFTELALDARAIPAVAQELAALGFAPAVDVLEQGDEVLVEALVPGVARHDVDVHVVESTLFLAGARQAADPSDGRVYVHAEIPRGPFRRVVPLPCGVSPGSRVEIDRGVVRIHLRKAPQPASVDAHAED